MALTKNVKSLYEHALKNQYLLGAYNIYNMESMKAVAEASQEENAPAILQIGPWTRSRVAPLKTFVNYMKEYLDSFDVPFIIQHDHCSTVEMAKEAVDAGMMAVMFDGSALPIEENIAKTKEVVSYAHAAGVWVEAELGKIPGFEHDIFEANMVYTEPKTAKMFADSTQCDSLAVAVGTAHGGVKAEESLKIDFELLSEIKNLVGDLPLVLHGAASLPFELINKVNALGGKVEYLRMVAEPDIKNARLYGVTKVNMDVDNWLCSTAALRKLLLDSPQEFCPIIMDDVMQAAFKEEVRHKILNVTMSKGQASTFVNE